MQDVEAISDSIVDALVDKSWYIIPLLMITAVVSGIFLEVPVKSLTTPMRYLLVVIALVIGAAIVGAIISDSVSEGARILGSRSAILLTKGDECHKANLLRMRKRKKMMIRLLGAGVVLAGIVGFAVNALSAYLLV
ncbi:hypothetical protein PIB19_09805 [Sphingomonas sp. 7/4-4]|uniref:hypothetical protein n=1 Tax=Sphingomonas sp. 7/4-4 TaxID=3018446 RepID=UPI0022F3A12F|nr:hypothetical protein [Sphingomonas sp. 7/4-4]WBY09558.1 hypothetical protein PIB19_09805 [Sphingomonas sp. 7/4-4]